ncbi:putative lipoprotein, partial [Escherichia coli PA25]
MVSRNNIVISAGSP